MAEDSIREAQERARIAARTGNRSEARAIQRDIASATSSERAAEGLPEPGMAGRHVVDNPTSITPDSGGDWYFENGKTIEF